MNRAEIEKLLDRLMEFLILDYATTSAGAVGGVTIETRAPTAEEVIEWMALRGCPREVLPPLSGLATFLSTFHQCVGVPARRAHFEEEGCRFPVGCVYSDYSTAHRLRVQIERDHIIPRARGGGGQEWQFQPLCRPHNLLKGNAVFWNASTVLPLEGWCERG